jgi:hypothetical protein
MPLPPLFIGNFNTARKCEGTLVLVAKNARFRVMFLSQTIHGITLHWKNGFFERWKTSTSCTFGETRHASSLDGIRFVLALVVYWLESLEGSEHGSSHDGSCSTHSKTEWGWNSLSCTYFGTLLIFLGYG